MLSAYYDNIRDAICIAVIKYCTLQEFVICNVADKPWQNFFLLQSLWCCVLDFKITKNHRFLDILVSSSHLYDSPPAQRWNPGPHVSHTNTLPPSYIPSLSGSFDATAITGARSFGRGRRDTRLLRRMRRVKEHLKPSRIATAVNLNFLVLGRPHEHRLFLQLLPP